MRSLVAASFSVSAFAVLFSLATAAAAGPRGPTRAPTRTLITPSELRDLGMKAAGAVSPRGGRVEDLIVSTTLSLAATPSSCALVLAELPALRRPQMTLPATLVLEVAGATVRVAASARLALPPDAVAPDISKGSSVSLHLTDGAIEITASAVAATDGDVGQVISVLLRPSGRVARGRLVSKTRAEWITGS
jgi:hypothetical protein